MASLSDIILVLGDFNMPGILWDTCSESGDLIPSSLGALGSFFDSLFEFGLRQVNEIRNNNGRLLDLVFCNCFDVSVSRTAPYVTPEDGYHPTLHVSFEFTDMVVSRTDGGTHGSRFSFRNTDFGLLSERLLNTRWPTYCDQSVDGQLSVFYDLLGSCFSRMRYDLKANPRGFYNFVNSKRGTRFPVFMRFNDIEASDSRTISDLFADFFQGTYVDSPAAMLEYPFYIQSYDIVSSIRLSYDEVLKGLKSLKSNYSPGPDGVPSAVLRHCACALYIPLTDLFNYSLASGHFPSVWKESFIVPLHKNGSIFDVRNYRILMYADDVKLFASVSSDVDSARLQGDFDRLINWCVVNCMTLNRGKCKSMTFSRRCALSTDYHIDDYYLEKVSCFKDLGVCLDTKLNFNYHIDSCVGKAMSVLGFIKRWSKEFDDPYLGSRQCKGIFCWGLGWGDVTELPPYVNRLRLIDLPTLERRRRMLDILFIVKLVNGMIDSDFLIGHLNFVVPSRPMRHFLPLRLPLFKYNYEANSPLNRLIIEFNHSFNLFSLTDSISCIKRAIMD
ncbi:uncharacterized protein LOC142239811 [Haematobia irritans]|uniref:uncharacterized protein LOC142239811 n=1 Tax=Haematobia irritans TaxID=7368 RepID=UPI003F4FEE28